MQRFDDYGWKEDDPAGKVEPGKLPLFVGGLWPSRFDSREKHPLFSINGVGRTLEPPYLILALEV